MAVRDLLGSAATPDTPGRRPVVIGVGIVAVIIGSAIGGYVLFRSAPERTADVASTDQTDQVVDAESPSPSDNAASWTVVADATRQTTDADAILGKPDGRSAAIGPGGAVAIAYASGKAFYNGEGADVRLDGPVGAPTPYTIFARDGSQERWLRFDVNQKGFPTGFAVHDFGHHQLEQATAILIRNEGSRELYIDAVTPLHLEPEEHEAARGREADVH